MVYFIHTSSNCLENTFAFDAFTWEALALLQSTLLIFCLYKPYLISSIFNDCVPFRYFSDGRQLLT